VVRAEMPVFTTASLYYGKRHDTEVELSPAKRADVVDDYHEKPLAKAIDESADLFVFIFRIFGIKSISVPGPEV